MNEQEIEQRMRIAHDTKKEFRYYKWDGKWYWHDRGVDFHGVDDVYGPFDTFLGALSDATEPYVVGELDAESEEC